MGAYLPLAAIFLSSMTGGGLSLQPEGKWNLDTREKSCVLQRAFSGDSQPWSVAILPHPGFLRMELLLTRHTRPNRRAGDKAKLTIRPSGAVFQGDVQTTASADAAVTYHVSVDPSLLAALSSATDMEIAVDRAPMISLPLPSMAAATTALEACEQDLLLSWGVDPARFRSVLPLDKLRGFPTSADYPAGASGASGRVVLLLELNTSGKVTSCALIESSGNAVLDQQTCNIALSRMLYPPLLDANGTPTTSWIMFGFRWVAP